MTEYLTKYMETVAKKLEECSDEDELLWIKAEHMDKIAFMQHERLIHFLVTMLFSLVLCIFICVFIFETRIELLLLFIIIMPTLIFYVKHYYFLENTVQKMYRVYDEILAKQKSYSEGKE